MQDEVINEYEEPTTIESLVGKTVKILDVQEVESEFSEAREIEVENIGTIRTYSRILGGQIQHLKDTDKLPTSGTVEKKKSKNGRNYFNFSTSSSFEFTGENNGKTRNLSDIAAKINAELAHKRQSKEQKKEREVR